MAAHDQIQIDSNQLRAAAGQLRAAADQALEIGARIPREVVGGPAWLALPVGEDLAATRRQLEELASELRDEAATLEARANEVDGAEATGVSAVAAMGTVAVTGTVVLASAGGGGVMGLAGDPDVVIVQPAPGADQPVILTSSSTGGGGVMGFPGEGDVVITQPAPGGNQPVIVTTSSSGGGGVMGFPGDPDVVITQPAPGGNQPVIMTTSGPGGAGAGLGLPGDPGVQIIVPQSSYQPIPTTNSTPGGGGPGGGVVINTSAGGDVLGSQGGYTVTVPPGWDPGYTLIKDAHGNVIGIRSNTAPVDTRPTAPMNPNVRSPGGSVPHLDPGNTVPGTSNH